MRRATPQGVGTGTNATPAAQETSARAVIGPLFTRAGFQSWFFVCLPRSIVAVPMGFWFALTANKDAAAFVGGAVGGAFAAASEDAGRKRIGRLMATPERQLASEPGSLVYAIGDLASVTFKKRVLSSSEIIVTTRRGERRVFGIMNAAEVSSVVEALVSRYGSLVRKE